MKNSIDCAPRARRVFALVVGLVALVVVSCGGSPIPAAASTSVSGALTSVAGTPTSVSGAPARWSWPVPLPHDVLRGFESPSEVWSPGHRGIDIDAPSGAVVVAPESGVVHFAGVVVDRPVLSLEHDGGLLSSFEPVTATVTRGDRVVRGQPIGILRPGHCAEVSCLHLGARIDGVYVSPLLLLGELRRAVLLPTRR